MVGGERVPAAYPNMSNVGRVGVSAMSISVSDTSSGRPSEKYLGYRCKFGDR